MIGGKPSATSPTSSNNNKPEKPPPKSWRQIWTMLKSSTRRLLGLDDKGLQ